MIDLQTVGYRTINKQLLIVVLDTVTEKKRKKLVQFYLCEPNFMARTALAIPYSRVDVTNFFR